MEEALLRQKCGHDVPLCRRLQGDPDLASVAGGMKGIRGIGLQSQAAAPADFVPGLRLALCKIGAS